MSTLPEVNPEVFGVVQVAFAEALGLDLEEVAWDARVIDELGAESLDFLDIAFRLERALSITIPRGGIEQAARGGVDDAAYEVDGVLTERGLAALAEAMPEVPREEFCEGLRVSEVPSLFRVGTFYHLVQRLLDEKEASERGAS